ncbi:hypothetical protein DY052_09110 [Apilactobacillus timberlakei]|uniref:hypothetical protein n=1 Tax=Apilactobacillus timberlakei TaxID=2008380 RepID=UPI001127D498|nr:hypothetical protein [Apilactobacillus timberlakei]TPR12807.1 hypothetical protein DY052_09110 [Apilactobacillus timberlakei]
MATLRDALKSSLSCKFCFIILGMILCSTFFISNNIHAQVVNDKIKRTNSNIGNAKFSIYNQEDNNVHYNVNGSGVKESNITPNANQQTLLGHTVMHFAINYAKVSDDTRITITYHNGARYGNIPLTTKLTINGFRRYPSNSYLGKISNDRYINVSTSLYKGLFYFGFLRAYAHYTFYHNGKIFNIGGQSDPSYLTFNSLNGVENSTVNHAYDKHIGEWVRYVHAGQSATGYVTKNTSLANLNIGDMLKEPGVKGIGGKPYTYFYDNQGGNENQQNSFLTHSVTFPAFSQDGHMFEFGASYGSAWYTLSTNGIKPKPKKKPQPTPDDQTGEKTVSKSTIQKQGDNFYYTIKGNLPEKHKVYETRYYDTQDPETYTVGEGKNKHTVTKTVTHTHSYQVEVDKNDSYAVEDNLPKDVSVTNISSHGINIASQDGNHLKFNASNDYMLNHSNGAYNIVIHVKANHLPKPTKDGFTDSSQKKGWYYFYNQAHINSVSYNKHFSHDTNKVHTRIKRIEGTVYHYDHDNDEDGDFGFNGAYDDAKNSDFDWNDNFDENNGVIKKDKVYGYNNDKQKVDILPNAYKNNNSNWKYRYVWGDHNQEEITLKDDQEDNGDDYEFARNFYFPYIVPRAKLHNEMIKIDTDKGKNGLPFQMIMSGESFLYRDFSDYNDAMVNINVFDKYNNAILYNKVVSLSSLLDNSQDGIKYTKLTGRLNTNGLNIPKGQKVNVNVQVSITDPNAIQEDHTENDDTFGFIASENALLGNNKGNNDNHNNSDNTNTNHSKKHYKQMSYTTVDPETYYVGSGQYRHQETKYVTHYHYYEVLVNDDEPVHYKQMSYTTVDPYTYTTGFGQYKHQVTINVTHHHYYEVPINASTNDTALNDNTFNNQANKTYFKGNQNDYIAPERTIKYDGVSQVRVLDEQLKLDQERNASAKTGFGMKNDLKLTYRGNLNAKQYMNDGTAMNYVFPKSFINNTNIHYDQDHHDHKLDKENMYNDRLNQVNNYQDSNNSFSDLDNLNSFNDDDNNKVNEISQSVPSDLQDEHFGTFMTKYDFYPRIAEYDNGNVDLATNVQEPQSHDDKGTDTGNDTAANFFGNQGTQNQAINNRDYRDGGNRFYTPLWLKLGKYNTSFDKVDYSNTDKSRLGANWLNIDELRPVNMYAHSYLSSNSPNGRNELQDQLSLQPILAEKQHVNGFTQSENHWINNPFDN